MAAGKRHRVKLKVETRANLDVEPNTDSIKITPMASEPGDRSPSPMEPVPSPLTAPFEYTEPGTLPSQQTMSRASASLAAARRRRMSKGSMSSSLKRSASTPNVRGLIASENGLSMADKRRNKLGYHRTSVACGRYCFDRGTE
ncbi:MAG: hypothetical protein Q9228_006184 [Teloschistes exilis]